MTGPISLQRLIEATARREGDGSMDVYSLIPAGAAAGRAAALLVVRDLFERLGIPFAVR